ncbi:histidinol-phosphate transaminase [Desulfohalovibrio reitneri]|uniref:histidinol-phosphate transaminase n=1 Tax=Desulfohalovibrio reitneri TaxID=1307759 RepID=UPI0004A74848|nr:histidinol-phosphate transaminase [Desulfohalovibrio reitneri]
MDPLLDIREEAAAFTPYVAGLSIDEIKNRYGLTNVVKLASNENPLGTSPVVKKAVAESAEFAFRYTRHGNPELNAAIAGHLGVDAARVVCGNGSDEIIDLLCRVKPRPGLDNVVACKPCFSMYRSQTLLAGAEFRQVPIKDDFSFDWDGLAEACDDNTALVFVTSPDNPSGYAATAGELAAFARRLPPRALLVVDEAYVDFCDELDAFSLINRLDEFPNVAVTRTFSKAYGLAGLRLGYGVLPPALAEKLLACQIPFSVNQAALFGGLAALEDTVHLGETLRVTRTERERLTRELTALGCRVQPSQANFLLFAPPKSAKRVFEDLLARGVIIRPLASYGLDDSLRVSIGREDENTTFLQALKGVLA